MSSLAYIRSRSSSRDGLALVTVLAFIVLLAILIVSFIAFSRLNRSATAGYSKGIQSQEIAQGGIQDILTDLHQEIIAGSRTGAAYTSGGTTVYPPSTNWTAAPARFGYATNFYGTDISVNNLPPTLVRVSRASQDGTPADFYPTNAAYYTSGLMTNRASAANTSTGSFNGRAVSAARWNKIDLLSTNTTIPPAFATNTPDWVYVTRGGSRACTLADLTSTTASILPSNNLTNSSQVVGRYAYAIYDEGALLDINTIGYTSLATNNYTTSYGTTVPSNSYTNSYSGVAQVLPGKSYSSYADLTQLPGFTATGAQTNIDNFIAWRNASAKLTTTKAGSATAAGTNYFQMVAFNATNGFLTAQTTASGTDSPLLGRVDMLNYLASVDPTRTSLAQATPYLGTFTRAANAPSWTPMANSQNLGGYFGLTNPNGTAFTSTVFGNVAYKDNAETAGTANRDISGVRYASTQTITHYNDDGTSYTYTVNAGDPVVQHRFSLAKIAWLGTTGPNTAAFNSSVTGTQQKAAILACFGLQFDGQSSPFSSTSVNHYDRWDYVAATTSNVHILTLDEVAAGCTATANTGYREPNFFELLKAGILSGSIGQSPGPIFTTSFEGPIAAGLDTFNTEKNRHVLQIGANIIDQFDSDSIPTAIYLQLFGVVPPAVSLSQADDLAFNTVFGDENLPGLTRVSEQVMLDWFDTTNKVGSWKEWIVPEIWNIHQTPSTGLTLPGHPTQFRVHAYGKVTAENNQNGGQPTGYNTHLATPMDWDDTSTAYSYHDASSHVPPTGAVATITGAQLPASVAVTTTTNQTAPANLVYFTDLATAASPYYRYPDFLQSSNLYAGGGYTTASSGGTPSYPLPIGFRGTALLNMATTPNDAHLTADGASPRSFAALFAGEDSNFPDWTNGGTNGAFVQYTLQESRPYFFSIECQDPVTLNWHPYNFISRISANRLGDNTDDNGNYTGTPGAAFTAGPPVNNCAATGQTNLGGRGGSLTRPDPRTDRFSIAITRVAQGQAVNFSMNPQKTLTYHVEDDFPWRTYGFVYVPDQGANPSGFGGGGGSWVSNWAINQQTASGNNAFYVDPDGVLRPGDSYRGNTTTGDGMLLYEGTASGQTPSLPTTTVSPTTPSSLIPTSLAAAGETLPIGSGQSRRPMILNRPFRSVGELGYAFRDLPFKTIDFFSNASGDGALLDLFSIADEPAISAGEIDVSNAPTSTLTAIMSGATKMEVNAQYAGAYNAAITAYPNGAPSASTGSPNFMTPTEATTVASSLTSSFYTNGPISNRADLVSRLDPILTTMSATYLDYGNKTYAEAPIRALANNVTTRTWNLLIDIIAQSGQMSPTATSLDNFVVQGEKRYWLHIAIDRYTGKILDQQLETVYE